MSTSYVCHACGSVSVDSGSFCTHCGAARTDQAAGALHAFDVPSNPVTVQIELAVRRFFARYAQFSGRAPANEFWWTTMVLWIFEIAYFALKFVCLTRGLRLFGFVLSLVFLIVFLGLVVPSIALAARRLHDSGRSAWWFLFGIIPIIGSIPLFVFYVLPSQPRTNKWGPPDPL